MAKRNPAIREIDCKVVYYGPAASGKTTNLKYVYERIDPTTRGTLISEPQEGAPTQFFDFLAVELGTVDDYLVRFHLFTVPGQMRSHEARQLVLRGVDGLVFVADSHRDRLSANLESLEDLHRNLRAHQLRLEQIPCVIQYNKRDLAEALPVPELDASLNPSRLQSLEAVAIEGRGVLESLTAVSKQVVSSLD